MYIFMNAFKREVSQMLLEMSGHKNLKHKEGFHIPFKNN